MSPFLYVHHNTLVYIYAKPQNDQMSALENMAPSSGVKKRFSKMSPTLRGHQAGNISAVAMRGSDMIEKLLES